MYWITIANFLPVEKKVSKFFWVYYPLGKCTIFTQRNFSKKGTYYIQQIMVMLNAIQELQFINFLV